MKTRKNEREGNRTSTMKEDIRMMIATEEKRGAIASLWQEVSFHLLGRVIFPHVFFSDHEYVFIDLVLKDSSKYGPGEWKLDNSLLEDKSYCEKIRALIFL